MTITRPHYRIRVEGTLGTGAILETFSIGYNLSQFADPGNNDDPTTQSGGLIPLPSARDYMNQHAKVWASTLIANASVSSVVKVLTIKVNRIGTDGKYAEPTPNVFTVAAGDFALIQGTGTPVPPFQCALAISTRTSVPRGPAHAGRTFLPGVCDALGGDGLLSAAQQSAWVVRAEAAYRAGQATVVNGADTRQYRPSIVGALPGFSGDFTPAPSRVIRAVRVGRVIDTQRRRRTSLPEVYSTTTIAYT